MCWSFCRFRILADKESRLEQAIIDELQKFLLELGKGFSFVARQMRISTETSHSMRVSMERIEKEGYNLNISRYISTAQTEEEIDLQAVNEEMLSLVQNIEKAKAKHNAYLKELGLSVLP